MYSAYFRKIYFNYIFASFFKKNFCSEKYYLLFYRGSRIDKAEPKRAELARVSSSSIDKCMNISNKMECPQSKKLNNLLKYS